MDKRLRHRILSKLAQTAPAAPATPDLGTPPAVPGDLFSTLVRGFNEATTPAIMRITNDLNVALHYASNGKGNFGKIRTNSYDMSGASPDAQHIGALSKMVFNTFLNSAKPFEGRVAPKQIHAWADAIVGSGNFSSLTQTEPGSKLSNSLQGSSGVGNLKDALSKEITAIKNANPITA